MKAPQLVPTVHGGVQSEWHTEAVDLILECNPAETICYCDAKTGEEVEVEGDEVGNVIQVLTKAFARLAEEKEN